jgi:hypothetical protein
MEMDYLPKCIRRKNIEKLTEKINALTFKFANPDLSDEAETALRDSVEALERFEELVEQDADENQNDPTEEND